jgi:hypothetical protein
MLFSEAGQQADQGVVMHLQRCLDKPLPCICTVPPLTCCCCFIHACSKLTKDVKMHVQRCLDGNHALNVVHAIKHSTISKGLKYSLATGNWGQQGTQGVRAGVSQVRLLRRWVYDFRCA